MSKSKIQKVSWGILALVGAAAIAGIAVAQQIVTPQPFPTRMATAGSGSVATTNTFQSIFASVTRDADNPNALRRGCLIINVSTNVQYVFFGPITNATTVQSVPLNPATVAGRAGGSVTCAAVGGGVNQDQISITGTAPNQFIALQE